jgi:hypothetical protein
MVDFDSHSNAITFTREAENMLLSDMLDSFNGQFSIGFRAAAGRLELTA